MTYHLLCTLLKILSCIPFRVMYVISDFLYYLIYYVFRYRRAVVRKNLTESFPEKSDKEIRDIERKFYRFFTDNLLETCKMTTISDKEIARRMRYVNMDTFNAVQREGKSVALYMGHFGNWEWCASMSRYFEKSTTSAEIYHKLRNDTMDRIMKRNRERLGGVCVEMRKTARYINEQAKAGRHCVIGFIADQSPRWKDSRYFLHFLNHDVPVLVGSEKIAKHYGYEAWFLKVRRVKRGFYEAEYVKMHDDPKSLPDFELTAIYFRMLEQAIQEQPELYLWTHRRFKHARKMDGGAVKNENI